MFAVQRVTNNHVFYCSTQQTDTSRHVFLPRNSGHYSRLNLTYRGDNLKCYK